MRTTVVSSCRALLMKNDAKSARILSTSEVSFVSRLMMRPMGVVWKNDIGTLQAYTSSNHDCVMDFLNDNCDTVKLCYVIAGFVGLILLSEEYDRTSSPRESVGLHAVDILEIHAIELARYVSRFSSQKHILDLKDWEKLLRATSVASSACHCGVFLPP